MNKPCEYVLARSNCLEPVYWVCMYLLIDESGRVSSFFHRDDVYDNIALARDCGVHLITRELKLLCSPDFMSALYRQIQDYENYVSSTYIDR